MNRRRFIPIFVIATFILVIPISSGQFASAQLPDSHYSTLSTQIVSEVDQLNSTNGNSTWVEPPNVIVQAFADILNSPGYYDLGNNTTLISSSTAFIISSPMSTILGVNSTPNYLFFRYANYSLLYRFNRSNNIANNFAVGIMNVTLSLNGQNMTDLANAICVFIMFETMGTYVDPSPATIIGGGGGGGNAWDGSDFMYTNSYIVYDNGFPTGESVSYTIFSVLTYVLLNYSSSAITSGFVNVSASWATTIPAQILPITLSWNPEYDVTGVRVNDGLGFGHSFSLPSSGTTYYGQASYTDQNTILYTYGSARWSGLGLDAIVEIETSMDIPQLT